MNAVQTGCPLPVTPWQEIVWWILTMSIYLGWWTFFSKRTATDFSLVERILAAFITSVSQIVGTTLILGLVNMVGWWELGILNALVTCVAFILAGLSSQGRNIKQELLHFIISTWGLLRSSLTLSVITVLALMVLLWYFYLGQLLPPMGYDVIGYHFPWAALAHQERHLGPFGFDYNPVNFYPMNADILFLWSIVGCGTSRWANVTQMPFAIAGVFSAYLLARRVGAKPVTASIVGLLVLSVPCVIHQMWIAYVDLAVMGGVMVSIAFLSRKKLSLSAVMIAALAAGFITGSKFNGLYCLFSLLLLLVYRFTPLGMDGFQHIRKSNLPIKIWALITFLGISTLFGSYFYLRNWVQTGNPTGIFNVRIASVTLFEGERDAVDVIYSQGNLGEKLSKLLDEWPDFLVVLGGFFDPQEYLIEANRIGGWGAVWTVFLLPAIPLALYWGVTRRKWSPVAIIVASLLPFFLSCRLSHTMIRFHLQIIAAGLTSFAFLLTIPSISRYKHHLLALAVFMMLLTLIISSPRRPYILTFDELEHARNKPYLQSDHYLYFDSWGDPDFAEALKSVQGNGTTLAIANWSPESRKLPAWNPHFTNRVIWAAWVGSGDAWEAYLLNNRADAVYVRPDTEELTWAENHPKRFRFVYMNDDIGAIYTLNLVE